MVEAPQSGGTAPSWRRYLFLLVPAAGVLELGAHIAQTRSAPPEADWRAARSYVEAHAKPEDLVTVAPRWAEPLAGMPLGAGTWTLERAARADETRFPRAFEVSLRGEHLPALIGWSRVDEQRFGALAVTTWRNPSPVTALDDLVAAFGPPRVRVSVVDGGRELDCSFQRGPTASGGLGFGPTIPEERFACPMGTLAAVTVVADLEYQPRRCVYAPPPSRGAVRIRFSGVRFGARLHGHHGLFAEAERHREGADVTLRLRAGDTWTDSVVHRDGEGWKPFELGTEELAGKTEDLVVEVSSPGGNGRMYCFTADTR